MNYIAATEAVVFFILILLSGFFSRAETAYTGVNRVKIRSLADDGDAQAARVLYILENYTDMLSSILIGNNIVNLSASALVTSLTIEVLGNGLVGLSTGFVTFLVLIFGEILPKREASAEPEAYAMRYAAFISVYLRVLRPLVWLIDRIARGIALLMHLNIDNAEDVITEEELKTYVEVSHEDGAIESDEMELIHNVFDFGDAVARDVMIPRIDMVTIAADATYEELISMFRSTMYTRIPVFKDPKEPDNMLGFVNIKDLLLIEDHKNLDIRQIMRKAYYTTETKKVTDLLDELRQNLMGAAFVVNEYGETVGMITMEDLLEELVGEIRDEYDSDEKELIRKINDRQYLINAAVKLDDVNDALGTEFDSQNFTSLGGILLEKLERIPNDGESVKLENGCIVKVRGMDGQRIKNLLLTLPEKKTDTEEAGHSREKRVDSSEKNMES